VFPTINIAQVVHIHVHEQTSPNLFSYFIIIAFFLFMFLHQLACGAGHRPSPGFEGDSDDLGCHGLHGSPKTGGGSDDLSDHGSYGSPPPAKAEIGYDY
jgi:hypothetical protein